MKKCVTIIAGVVVAGAIIGVGTLCVLSLCFGNNVSINVSNRFGVALRNVAVMVAGSPFSGRPEDMAPETDFAFATNPQIRFPIRVVFDAAGRHHDVPATLRLPPFGAFIVSITIDQRMHVSFKTSLP